MAGNTELVCAVTPAGPWVVLDITTVLARMSVHVLLTRREAERLADELAAALVAPLPERARPEPGAATD